MVLYFYQFARVDTHVGMASVQEHLETDVMTDVMGLWTVMMAQMKRTVVLVSIRSAKIVETHLLTLHLLLSQFLGGNGTSVGVIVGAVVGGIVFVIAVIVIVVVAILFLCG